MFRAYPDIEDDKFVFIHIYMYIAGGEMKNKKSEISPGVGTYVKTRVTMSVLSLPPLGKQCENIFRE